MRTYHSPAVAFSLSPITLCPVMVCPRNRVGPVKIAGMDSQGIGNLFAGVSAFGAIVSAILAYITWRQALGSKEAKAKADEAHKAALDMRDAAKRSAEAAQEKVNQAEKLLEQMQQIVSEQQSQSESQSKIAANLWRSKFQLTHVQGMRYKLQNITEQSLNVLKVVNQDEFVRCNDIYQQFNPGESLDIRLGAVARKPLPSNLILQLEGRNEPVYVQIPAKSG